MPATANTGIIKHDYSAVHLGAAAMAAHDAYLQAADPYFESCAPIPPATDETIGEALSRHSQLSTRLAQVAAPDPDGMRAKAAVLLSEMTLRSDGTVCPGDRALAMAYSLARDILADGFQAALDRAVPPHHRG